MKVTFSLSDVFLGAILFFIVMASIKGWGWI